MSGLTNQQSQDSLKALVDSVAQTLSRSAVGGFTNPKSEEALKALVDSVARTLSRSAVGGFTNPKSEAALKALVDSVAHAFGEGVVLGATSGRARDSLAATVDSLGEAITRRVVALRDSLFPPSTRRSLDSIAENLAELTQPQTLSFIKESAEEILGTAIAGLIILALIIGYFFVRSRRNRRILDLVTTEIDNMSDTQREALTERIKERALETGLEPHLHEALEEQRRKRGGSQ